MNKLTAILVILATSLSLTARADSIASAQKLPTSLPAGAVALGEGGISSGSFTNSAYALKQCQSEREAAAFRIYSQIVEAKSLDAIDQYGFTGKPNIQGDVQYACKEIIIKTLPRILPSGTSLSMVSGTVHAFCVPRSLAEKQLISFAKKCELNPMESCFEERVLRRLESVRSTVVTYDHSSPCRTAGEH